MNKNFYDVIESKIIHLNKTDKNILEYVIKNMDHVREMGIRELAERLFLSSTSIFRFVKKLGFKGYSDFISCLTYTNYKNEVNSLPKVMQSNDYHQAYIANLTESVRVLSANKVNRFRQMISTRPRIYILYSESCVDVANYAIRLMGMLGIIAIQVGNSYELVMAEETIQAGDLLFVIANKEYNKLVGKVERLRTKYDNRVISLTSAANNAIQGMTDLDFYVFSDDLTFKEMDMTPKLPMFAIVELLIYDVLKERLDLKGDLTEDLV